MKSSSAVVVCCLCALVLAGLGALPGDDSRLRTQTASEVEPATPTRSATTSAGKPMALRALRPATPTSAAERAPPRSGPDVGGSPRPLDLVATQPERLLASEAPLAAASATRKSLAEATAKLVARQEKRIARAESAIAKQELKITLKEEALAIATASLAMTEADLVLIQGFLGIASGELEAALAMPEGSPEQQVAKLEAIAHASQGVKLAQKELASIQKQVNSLMKKLDKLAAAILKHEASIAKYEDKIDVAEDETAFLQTPFDFDAARTVVGTLLLRDGFGAPLAGVEVLVGPSMLPPKGKGSKRLERRSSGELFGAGRTDVSGQLQLTLELPDALESLDLIVLAPGYAGPYTHEKLRERWGIFAPAARLSVDPEDLDGMIVDLIELEP